MDHQTCRSRSGSDCRCGIAVVERCACLQQGSKRRESKPGTTRRCVPIDRCHDRCACSADGIESIRRLRNAALHCEPRREVSHVIDAGHCGRDLLLDLVRAEVAVLIEKLRQVRSRRSPGVNPRNSVAVVTAPPIFGALKSAPYNVKSAAAALAIGFARTASKERRAAAPSNSFPKSQQPVHDCAAAPVAALTRERQDLASQKRDRLEDSSGRCRRVGWRRSLPVARC